MGLSPATSDDESFVMEDAAARIGVSKDAFFRRLAVEDPAVQMTILTLVQQELRQLILEDIESVADLYPTIVRLAREAPFDSIRDCMSQLQEEVESAGVHDAISTKHTISYFIDSSEIEKVAKNENEELSCLYRVEYLRTGRVSHFAQLLAWHSSYLQLHQKSIKSIMVQDGALPLHWRSYLALMAASELRCHYFADLQQYNFVVNGGSYEWTKGIDYVSPKLFRIHEISSILAHRPWLITPKHIAELLNSDQDDSWSVSELVHAIAVLCQYHSMSSIALGLGCAEEEDLSIWSHCGAEDAEQRVIRYLQHVGSAESSGSTDASSGVDIASIDRDEGKLLELLKAGSQPVDEPLCNDETVDDDETTADEGDFEIAEGGDFDFSTDCNSRRQDTLWRFCGGVVMRYADFDVHSSEYAVLNTEDFSWEEHGFSLMRRYFPGKTGEILEDQFNLTSKLTYEYYGSQKEGDVDTSPYRNAIWYYVHRIFGICHDDYDYRQVNVFLNRPTKIFIKKVACTPWKVTKDDFEHFDHSLSPSEKCHVTLLVAEARKQAGLMYGLRAVMQHMR